MQNLTPYSTLPVAIIGAGPIGLAAAAHLGADPTRCLVIEDTATGARAGRDAGATVWGYCPDGHGRAFEGLPVARVLHHMDELARFWRP